MKPGGQRRKGHDFERRVARDLREIWPEAKRGFQSRGGTKEAPDVDGTDYYIECKHEKKPDRGAAWNQADDAMDGRPAVAITKATDSREILVTMEFRHAQHILGPYDLVSFDYRTFLDRLRYLKEMGDL